MSFLPYGVAAWLLLVGLYGVVTSRNLVHAIICLSVAQSSTYILLLSVGFERGGTAPIFLDVPVGTKAVDPVVGALALTDVVVGATVSALLLALAVQAYKHHGSLDPERLRKGPGLSADALPALAVALPLLVAAVLVGLAPGLPAPRGRRRHRGHRGRRDPLLFRAPGPEPRTSRSSTGSAAGRRVTGSRSAWPSPSTRSAPAWPPWPASWPPPP